MPCQAWLGPHGAFLPGGARPVGMAVATLAPPGANRGKAGGLHPSAGKGDRASATGTGGLGSTWIQSLVHWRTETKWTDAVLRQWRRHHLACAGGRAQHCAALIKQGVIPVLSIEFHHSMSKSVPCYFTRSSTYTVLWDPRQVSEP